MFWRDLLPQIQRDLLFFYMSPKTSLLQVNLQCVVLVSLFRQASRERIMEWIEWCLPDRIPYIWDKLGYTDTPAQILHRFVVNRIKGFQAGVALRQSSIHPSNRYRIFLLEIFFSGNFTISLHLKMAKSPDRERVDFVYTSGLELYIEPEFPSKKLWNYAVCFATVEEGLSIIISGCDLWPTYP